MNAAVLRDGSKRCAACIETLRRRRGRVEVRAA